MRAVIAEQNAILLRAIDTSKSKDLLGLVGGISSRGPTLLLQALAGEGLRCDEDEDPSVVSQ